MSLKTVIGLEIHVQLMTKTKAFCSCRNDSSETEPNKNTCPVCVGHPGTLPVLNSEMVKMGLKTALALNCKINKISGFDRKNYFYPDMPKGYQITQFFVPIAEQGKLRIISKRRKKDVQIKRIHLEEDSGKMIYEKNKTLVDYNRSGIPLIEIVTEPVIDSSEEAVMVLDELKTLLKYLQVCDGNLENGSMRCDVNISVMNVKNGLSTNRIEIKNLNSFKNVQKALFYEEKELIQQLKSGNSEPSLTKSWDEKKRVTCVMRKKEQASDYRYFPEPDLPLLKIDDKEIRKIKAAIPELPSEKLERLMEKYYLKYEEARILTSSQDIVLFFEKTVSETDSKEAIKWILRDVKRYLNEKNKKIDETKLSPHKLAGLINHIKNGKISNSVAKEILVDLFESEKNLKDMIEEEDFLQQNDPEILKGYLEEIISENYEQYEAYQLGKTELFNFFIGKMMSVTRGRSRPKLIIKILRERLG